MGVRSEIMSSEVDINVLVGIYNQRISTLVNQNILLEAKLQSLIQDFEQERNSWSLSNTSSYEEEIEKSKKSRIKTSESYQESGVE